MTDTQPERDSQFNLGQFLKDLTLQPMIHTKFAPPMPPRGCPSVAMPLIMPPGGYRNLVDIKVMDYLEDEATFFFNNFNPSVEICEAVKALKLMSQLSGKELEKLLLSNPYVVDANHGALFVIERGAMGSTLQLVHAINPELQHLGFCSPNRCGVLNAQKLDPVYFCSRNHYGTLENVKCVIITLPPWEFAPRDFEDFTTMEMFEDACMNPKGMNADKQWSNADRMWAYLHDICLIQDCHHFVITTHEQWVFGAFSDYYSTGFVSRIIPWDSKPSSVLELFTYWILGSCRTENTIVMEKVPREKNYDPDILEQTRDLCRERLGMDKQMSSGSNITTAESRPSKRARKDPLEDRTGWEPLTQHADALFQSPTRAHFSPTQESHASNSFAAGSSRGPGSDIEDDDDDMFARPVPNWNGWYNKRKREPEDKENPEHVQDNQLSDETTNLATHPELGHPIPCYSSDIDRDNDCFRPELIRLASFSIPTPRPRHP